MGRLTQLANLNQHHLGPVKIIQSPGTNLGGYFYQYGYFIWTFLRYWSKSNRINITLTVSAYEAKQLLVLEEINNTIKKCCLRIKMTPSVRRICAFKTPKALRSYCIFYCNQVRLSDWLRLHLQLCICHRFIRSSQLFLFECSDGLVCLLASVVERGTRMWKKWLLPAFFPGQD